MLQLKTLPDGSYMPVLVCEACWAPIEDASEAVIFLPLNAPVHGPVPVLHAHTGSCSYSTLLLQECADDWTAQSLGEHLKRLVEPVGLALAGAAPPALDGEEMEDALLW